MMTEPKKKLTQRERALKYAEQNDLAAWSHDIEAELHLDEGNMARHAAYVGLADDARKTADHWRALASRYLAAGYEG